MRDDNNVRRRNVLKGIGGSVPLAAGLAGCIGGGGQTPASQPAKTNRNGEWPDLSGKSIHIINEYAVGDRRSYWEQMARDFESKTSATVNIETISRGSSTSQRIAQLLQAGKPPELAVTEGYGATRFWNQDAIAPVSRSVGNTMDKLGDIPRNLRVPIEGEEWLFPVSALSTVHWYREDIYDSIPTTWDELLTEAKAAYQKQEAITGYLVPTKQSYCGEAFYAAWGWTNDAHITQNVNGELQVVVHKGDNRDRWIETFEYLRDLHQYSTSGTSAGCQQIVQALAAEISAGGWYSGARPKFQAVEQDRPFADKIRGELPPRSENGDKTCYGVAKGFVTFRGANNDAAQTFLEYMIQPEVITSFYLANPTNVPVWPGIRNSDPYQQGLDKLDDAWSASDIQVLFDSVDKIQTWATETKPPNPYAGSFLAEFQLVTAAYKIMIQGEDLGAAVDTAGSNLSNYLAELKG